MPDAFNCGTSIGRCQFSSDEQALVPMTAKSLRRRLSHLFKHAPATSAISPTSGVSLLYRTEAIGRQQTHTPQKVRGEESVLSAPHIHSRVDFRIFSSMLPPLPRFVFTDVIRDGHCGARTCMASPSMRRRGPWAVPDARASWHLLANQTLF